MKNFVIIIALSLVGCLSDSLPAVEVCSDIGGETGIYHVIGEVVFDNCTTDGPNDEGDRENLGDWLISISKEGRWITDWRLRLEEVEPGIGIFQEIIKTDYWCSDETVTRTVAVEFAPGVMFGTLDNEVLLEHCPSVDGEGNYIEKIVHCSYIYNIVGQKESWNGK